MTVRLLKVIVQPVFIADDGEHLSELVVEPVTVSAAEWPTYPIEGFQRALDRHNEIGPEMTDNRVMTAS